MAGYQRKRWQLQIPFDGMEVCMADAAGRYFNEDFARGRRWNLHVNQRQGPFFYCTSRFKRHRFHPAKSSATRII
jgi:hypothetical protein